MQNKFLCVLFGMFVFVFGAHAAEVVDVEITEAKSFSLDGKAI